jgi:hypothetical protein
MKQHRQWASQLLTDTLYQGNVRYRLLADLVVSESGCWTSSRLKPAANGYTTVGVYNAVRHAHVVLYLLTYGEPGQHLELDHTCRNRACFNPEHLEPVTHQENMKRSPLVGKSPKPRKTECPKGHPYVGENLILTKRGHSRCRTCANEKSAERYAKTMEARQAPTSCKNGHPYTGESAAVDKLGVTYCTICRAEAAHKGGALGGRPRKSRT